MRGGKKLCVSWVWGLSALGMMRLWRICPRWWGKFRNRFRKYRWCPGRKMAFYCLPFYCGRNCQLYFIGENAILNSIIPVWIKIKINIMCRRRRWKICAFGGSVAIPSEVDGGIRLTWWYGSWRCKAPNCYSYLIFWAKAVCPQIFRGALIINAVAMRDKLGFPWEPVTYLELSRLTYKCGQETMLVCSTLQ
jgi:hypothetical protein